jgi:hypothetical protein
MTGSAVARASRRALTCAFGLSIGWFTAEAVIFLAEPQLAQTFQYDADLGFRVKPYSHASNRFGFNDRDYALRKPSDSFRVLFIGDSFGWTGGLEGNYTAIVERRFADAPGGSRVEVINTGYSMTHTAEQFASLQRDGLQYDPDLVVLGFYAGNDFTDADPTRRRIALMDTYLDVNANEMPQTIWGRPLLARSRLWPLLSQRWRFVSHAIQGGQPGGRHGMTRQAYLEEAGHNMHFYDRRKHEAGEFDANIAHIFGAVDAMRALVAARGGRFAVVIIPADFSVSPVRAAAIHERHAMDPQHYDLHLAQKILGAHLASQGTPFLDLLPVFKQSAFAETAHLPNDLHWSNDGIVAAADATFAWLRRLVGASGDTVNR